MPLEHALPMVLLALQSAWEGWTWGVGCGPRLLNSNIIPPASVFGLSPHIHSKVSQWLFPDTPPQTFELFRVGVRQAPLSLPQMLGAAEAEDLTPSTPWAASALRLPARSSPGFSPCPQTLPPRQPPQSAGPLTSDV